MNRIKELFQHRVSYEPIDGGASLSTVRRDTENGGSIFSRTAYAVFFLIGVAMLWAWNMFLAAGPYFQRRFQDSKPILSSFQASELSVSTLANLGAMIVLAKLQENADYPKRVITSLIINGVCFTLLALSTKLGVGVSAAVYFGFLIVMVFASSLATGFMQNGSFAFASGFGRPEYLQAIMMGQGVAGVLPPMVQMVSVLSAGEGNNEAGQASSTSAFAYFLTATGVSAATLLAFVYLTVNQRPHPPSYVSAAAEPLDTDDGSDAPALSYSPGVAEPDHKPASDSVPMKRLARTLAFPASAVFITFAVTMVFPVFTQKILSTHEDDVDTSPLLRKPAFIPLAFLVWNIGDLLGRSVPLAPKLSLAARPKTLLILSILRIVFIPMYLVCNIERPSSLARSVEAVPFIYSSASSTTKSLVSNLIRSASQTTLANTHSDTFYLLITQFPFGLSNGYLGACCMMGANDCVEKHEHEAAGAFMGLSLVAGLAVGSLCSFWIAVAAT